MLCEDGSRLECGAVPPDADGLRGLARRVEVFDELHEPRAKAHAALD